MITYFPRVVIHSNSDSPLPALYSCLSSFSLVLLGKGKSCVSFLLDELNKTVCV